jgi:hypothetical protein
LNWLGNLPVLITNYSELNVLEFIEKEVPPNRKTED